MVSDEELTFPISSVVSAIENGLWRVCSALGQVNALTWITGCQCYGQLTSSLSTYLGLPMPGLFPPYNGMAPGFQALYKSVNVTDIVFLTSVKPH